MSDNIHNPVTVLGQNDVGDLRPLAVSDDGALTVKGISPDGSGTPTVSGDYGGSQPVTIAEEAAITDSIDLGTRRLALIIMPDAWTAAALTFQVSVDGETFFDLYNEAGTEVEVDANSSIAVRLSAADWRGIRHLKIRSGTAALAVDQEAERTLTLVTVA
jgi:mRNA-degrading endonuclease toxin of MazEF toxin-antitoxin module